MLRDERSGDRILVRGELFRTLPGRPWGPPSLLYNGYQAGHGAHPASCTIGIGSFPAVKRPGRGVDHPLTSSAEAKERVQLYLYSSPGTSWPILG